MTLRQQKFCDEYIICGNATEAAIKAGYSQKNTRNVASEILAKPYIREYIDQRLAEIKSSKIADAEEVLSYLTSVMRGEHTEEIPILGGGAVVTADLSSGQREPRCNSRAGDQAA